MNRIRLKSGVHYDAASGKKYVAKDSEGNPVTYTVGGKLGERLMKLKAGGKFRFVEVAEADDDAEPSGRASKKAAKKKAKKKTASKSGSGAEKPEADNTGSEGAEGDADPEDEDDGVEV